MIPRFVSRNRIATLAATLSLASLGAATPSVPGVGQAGIQNPDIAFLGACVGPEAPLFVEITFEYVRGIGEDGAISWSVKIWDKDLNGNQFVVNKSGGFPSIADGGQPVEQARANFNFDVCPIITTDDDGNICAELFYTIEVDAPDPNAVHFLTTESTPHSICCDTCISLAIELESFDAIWSGNSVFVAWKTASEIDTVGFRVLRGPTKNGPFTPVQPGIIPAVGGPTQGASYSINVASPGVFNAPWYRLQDIDVHGVVTDHPPVLVEGLPARVAVLASMFHL